MTALRRFVLSILLPVLCAGVALAQTPATITLVGNSVKDGGGTNLLATGQICALTTDSADRPMGYRIGSSGGQTSASPSQASCTSVTNGAIAAMSIINSATSSPSNACIRISTFAPDGTEIRRDKCVQTGTPVALGAPGSPGWCAISGTAETCNWDQYPQGTSPLTVQGNQGLAGATGPQGASGTLITSGTGTLITGDSIADYTGCVTTADCFATLIGAYVGGTLNNAAIGQRYLEDEPLELMFAGNTPPNANNTGFKGMEIPYPTEANNPVYLEQGGKNSAYGCTSLNGSTQCLANGMAALTWTISHRATNNIVKASQCVASSGWSADTFLQPKAGAMASTTQGSTLTCKVTTYGSSAIEVGYRAITNNGGTASVTIDGTAQSSISAQGVSGSNIAGISVQAATGTLFSNLYPVPAGTHTVVLAVTSATSTSNLVAITDVAGNTAGSYQGAPNAWVMEIMPNASTVQGPIAMAATYSAAKQALANQFAGYGYNVHWAPILNVPYQGAFDPTKYINNQPTVTDPDGTACVGTTYDDGHPNKCGHKQIALALAKDLNIAPKDGSTLTGDGICPNSYVINTTAPLPNGACGVFLQLGQTLTIPSGLSSKMLLYVTNVDTAAVATIVGGSGVNYEGPTSLNPGEGMFLANATSAGPNHWFRVDSPLFPITRFRVVSPTDDPSVKTIEATDQTLLLLGGVSLSLPTNFAGSHSVTILNFDSAASSTLSGGGNSLSVTLLAKQALSLVNNLTYWFVSGSTAGQPTPTLTATGATPTGANIGITFGNSSVDPSHCNSVNGVANPSVKACLVVNFGGTLSYLPFYQ